MRLCMDKNVEKSELQFWSIRNMPSVEQIEEYYSQEYYQSPHGSYETEYNDSELAYILARVKLKFYIVSNLLKNKMNSKSLLDIGCGEGFLLSYFAKQGYSILGLDFSLHGVEKHNNSVKKSVIQGDIYKSLNDLIVEKTTFDVVHLGNVLEHVIDPIKLLSDLKSILKPHGLLIATVPNDFSLLQESLVENNFVTKQYWISPPDHLHYFNSNGLRLVSKSVGFCVKKIISDFPIEWFLTNPESNYIESPSKGKSAHKSRIFIENFISANIDIQLQVDFWESLATLGFGRSITAFLTID